MIEYEYERREGFDGEVTPFSLEDLKKELAIEHFGVNDCIHALKRAISDNADTQWFKLCSKDVYYRAKEVNG
jgi:hypothetical protein